MKPIETYRARLAEKLGLRGRAELVAKAGGVHNPELAKAILEKAKQAAEQAVSMVSR